MCYCNNRERKLALNGQKRWAVFSSYKDKKRKNGTTVLSFFITSVLLKIFDKICEMLYNTENRFFKEETL